MQFRNFRTRIRQFRTRTAILEGADCPTLCGKTSMASFPVIAAHERTFGVNENVADVLHALHWLLARQSEPESAARILSPARAASRSRSLIYPGRAGAAKRNSRKSSKIRLNAGPGARHMVRYVSRKGSQRPTFTMKSSGFEFEAPGPLPDIDRKHRLPLVHLSSMRELAARSSARRRRFASRRLTKADADQGAP
jgi:hypothetical protein